MGDFTDTDVEFWSRRPHLRTTLFGRIVYDRPTKLWNWRGAARVVKAIPPRTREDLEDEGFGTGLFTDPGIGNELLTWFRVTAKIAQTVYSFGPRVLERVGASRWNLMGRLMLWLVGEMRKAIEAQGGVPEFYEPDIYELETSWVDLEGGDYA